MASKYSLFKISIPYFLIIFIFATKIGLQHVYSFEMNFANDISMTRCHWGSGKLPQKLPRVMLTFLRQSSAIRSYERIRLLLRSSSSYKANFPGRRALIDGEHKRVDEADGLIRQDRTWIRRLRRAPSSSE